MGRPLGAYDGDELDRPDLNKCPDCGCFFATETCTLCGKICPEEMRAGNRSSVKHKRRRSGGYSGRVQFIPWYHTWWFIALMLWWMLPVGVILFFTSPYSKKTKIILTSVAVVGVIAFYGGAALLMNGLLDKPLVNDDISRGEYVSLCESMPAEDFYRYCESRRYITMELKVEERIVDYAGDTYYRCTDREGGTLSVLLRDCRLEEKINFLPGDVICVFGESGGMGEISASTGTYELPCLYLAYAELIS